MPHDKNGHLLKEGDVVSVKAVVKQIDATEEYCNATLESVEPMFPGNYKNVFTINTKQCEWVSNSDMTNPPPPTGGDGGDTPPGQ